VAEYSKINSFAAFKIYPISIYLFQFIVSLENQEPPKYSSYENQLPCGH
jgi:hypothetical protein